MYCVAFKVEVAIVLALAQQRRANALRLSISGMSWPVDMLLTLA